MNKNKLTILAAVALCAATAHAVDWTGAQDSRWSNDANWADNALPGETDNVSFADWRIRYSANKVTVVNLEGAEKTVANIYVGTASDLPITVTNGTLRFTKCEIANKGSACELIVSNAMLAAENVTVGGNGWNGGGTGVVHQVGGSVVAEALILGYGENGAGSYVLEGGSAVFTNLSYGANIWTSKAGEALFALNGGTLSIDAINNGGCHGCESSTFIFNGGALKLTANNSDLIPSWLAATVDEGGLSIDTDGHDVTIKSGRIVEYCENASIEKKGAGTLSIKDSRTWTGTVAVLGGTLDLNGGTITGPLVLGGDGKIVNGTVQTTDITILGGCEFAPQQYSEFADGAYNMPSLKVGPGASVVAPVKGLLSSAVGWYDPSDATTVLCDENGGVTNLANKGVAGASCDMLLKESSAEPPYVAQVNGLDVLVFTNNYGFEAKSRVNMDLSKGRSVFAAARFGDTDNGKVTAIEWSRGEWTWDAGQLLRLSVEPGKTYANCKYLNEEDADKDTWLGANNPGASAAIYVNSARDLPDAEGTNLWARVTGYSGGNVIDNKNTVALRLKTGEGNYRISYGWSKGGKSRSNGLVGEALAYDRCLADEESDLVHAYLGHKWVSSEIPAPVAKLNVGALALEGGTVGFEGSEVAVGNLSGTGTLNDLLSLTVTGTVTAKLVAAGAAIAVDAPLDLTGTTLILDESVFVLDESAFALADVGDTATVFTATSITGKPTLRLAEGDKRKIKVRSTGTAITVERVRHGLCIILQ